MNDKPASPQIVDLFEAIKSTLLTASQHPPRANERSVGDVPAPIDDVRFKRPKYAGADETRNDAEAERAAVVKYLRGHLRRYIESASWEIPENREGRALLNLLIDDIEEGEHVK